MILDPNRYRRALDGIKPQLMADNHMSPEWKVTEVSAANHIPLLAVVLYALRHDMLGPIPRLQELAIVLRTFNSYSDVLPWKDAA